MLDRLISAYNEAVLDTDRSRALAVVRGAVDEGITPEQIVFDVVLPSMDVMIRSLGERNKVSLAQHFIAAQIADSVTAEMVARFQTAPEVQGRVVIGNSRGDLHALGKRIVIGCLKARLIDVIDLGTNVAPEAFVDAAVASDAQVIGISSMMVHTARSETACLGVRRLLKERGLEKRIKLVVGGAPYRFDHELYKVVQADAWAESAMAAGPVIEDLIKEVRA
jgi:methylmalonyl-CoA mutase cobalamin-binding domain/chain